MSMVRVSLTRRSSLPAIVVFVGRALLGLVAEDGAAGRTGDPADHRAGRPADRTAHGRAAEGTARGTAGLSDVLGAAATIAIGRGVLVVAARPGGRARVVELAAGAAHRRPGAGEHATGLVDLDLLAPDRLRDPLGFGHRALRDLDLLDDVRLL